MAFEEAIENFAAKIRDRIDEDILDEVRAEVWTPPEHNIEPADLPTFVPESPGSTENRLEWIHETSIYDRALGEEEIQTGYFGTCTLGMTNNREYPRFIPQDLIDTQPMTSPTSLVFHIHHDTDGWRIHKPEEKENLLPDHLFKIEE